MADDYRGEPRPIPVHVTSSAPGALPGAAGATTYRTVYRTVKLTNAEPCQEIMAASDDRVIAWVVAVDADIYLSDNRGDAQAGTGTYVPCVIPAATKPSLQSPYPVQDYRVVYAAAVVTPTGTNVTRVSVSAVYRD